MKDKDLVKALFEHKEAWRYANENKFVECYPRPLVAMLDATFREKIETEQELKRWKAIAGYLADCHTANAECPPKSLSKRDRQRYSSILEKCIDFLKDGVWPSHSVLMRPIGDIVNRCIRAHEDLEA